MLPQGLDVPSTPFPDTHISPSIAYIQLVIFSLELLALSIGFGSLLAWKPTYLSFHYGNSLDFGWNLLDGSFTAKRRRTRSQFELVQTPCHVLQGQHTHLCYSLVVGLAPLGPSGLKGFILLNSSGLRQRVKNRYSQHVVRLLLLSPL
jgi:hypothetical protein